MKINQCTASSAAFLYKNEKNNSETSAASSVSSAAAAYPLYPVNAYHLSSKFNISFGSSFDDKKLSAFCLNLENRIKEMITPKNKDIGQNALTPGYIDIINSVFKQDNIGKTAQTGISANIMLNYLAAKNQLELDGNNTAFVIDKFSLDFLKKQGREFLLCNKYKFYCLDTNEEETEKLIKDFHNLTGGKYTVKKIIKPEGSKAADYPDADTIKTIIKEFAEYKFKSSSERDKFIDLICKYLENSLYIFSYASLEEKLKEHYKNIEKYVKSSGRTMDSVIYALPEENKSYDLINYLYAKANNIPADKFQYFSEIRDMPSSVQRNKIYAVIDDICAGWESICRNIPFMNINMKNIIIAPVVSYKTGRNSVEKNFQGLNHLNYSFIPCLEYNDLGWAYHLLYYKPNYKGTEQYIKDNYNLSVNDAVFLLRNLRGGYAKTHGFVSFPYMIPDSSSEINAFIGAYCLNKDCSSANKAVNYKEDSFCFDDKIWQYDYNSIKTRIENSLNK